MNQINKAVKILKQGGIIAYPTETIYGIGCNIFNEKAVKKIFEIKGRDFNKPLLVAVSSFKMMQDICFIPEKYIDLIKKYLPGPVTFLWNKKNNVSNLITQSSDLVGIRFPDNKKALKIIEKCNFPIISTSANISGQKDSINWKQVKLNVDFIVKGRCKYKKPTSVINLMDKKILRKGYNIEKYEGIIE
ncbi:threonylcarbamoyl-AMP synthase [Patescibacteria group bacterium]|nr:threonylcarbamoyl-AMP synthase [Patescibacteria group bacterium]